jgi:hypothetical protein
MAGFVYVMTNPSYKDELIKIGKSDRDPSIRSNELYTTPVPEPFRIEYYAFVTDHHALERIVHNALAERRSNVSREFFICPVPLAIETIRRNATSSIKFEEVFYKDKDAIQRERAIFDEQTIKAKRDRAEQAASAEKTTLFDRLELDLRQIVAVEIEREQRIQKSRSLLDKFLRSKEPSPYYEKLQLILLGYIADVTRQFREEFDAKNWSSDQAQHKSNNAKRSLTHLVRLRLGEYYGDFFDNYNKKYWGLVKNGKIVGPAVIFHKKEDGWIWREQGNFLNGDRDGEFINQNNDGKIWLATYTNGSQSKSSWLDPSAIEFHKDQGNSHYSIVKKPP